MHDNLRLGDLLARSALRDQSAFAELYRYAAPKLFAVALRILRRDDWAEEVLQESFVSIWNHADGYSSTLSAPMTWMTAIVRNRALDWVRRPNIEAGDENYDVLLEALPDEAAGPETLLGNSRDGRALAECMKELSGSQRQSIALAYVHGLSHGELAEHMKEPLGTVKTWIRRGLERLRGCLDSQHDLERNLKAGSQP